MALGCVALVDGYVDEPTCLGVPPYVSTYVRYAAGACLLAGAAGVDLYTIEALRDREYSLKGGYAHAVIISGNPVPGKYLGGLPIRPDEFDAIARANPKTYFLAGGPVQFGPPDVRSVNISFVKKDIEMFCHSFFSGGGREEWRDPGALERFCIAGASIVEQYPRYPDIIVELETGRGCPRTEHCSFCIEGSFRVEFRDPGGVAREAAELRRHGVRNFRLGKQPDLFAFGSRLADWRRGFPRPEPEAVRRLYEGIRGAVPDLEVLHLDNVNPGTVFHFPEESRQIAETIVGNNTPGDTAAFGLESADPEVIKRNFLKVDPGQARDAVALINSIGSARADGVPKLLPGLNLIRGLIGENRDTFRLNFEFLRGLMDEGLLVRRINIRQIRPSPGTPICGSPGLAQPGTREWKKLDAAFRNYREKIRDTVDAAMLRKIYPVGTVLKNAIVETNRGDWSIARQLGSYPVAVNIPARLPPLMKLDVFITGCRERSLVGLARPLRLSGASLLELRQLPGFSKKAGEWFAAGRKDRSMLSSLPSFGAWKDSVIF